MSQETCDVYSFDKKTVELIRNNTPQEDIKKAGELFKLLADPTRLKIAYALTLSELCVCDAAQLSDISTAVASHHLRTMKKFGLVRVRKEGKLAIYQLDDDHVKELVINAVVHAGEVKDNV
ncbi:ArsR/SmtB family transcription factor [Salisediminibacterium halotolerans]|uniref:ArsR/SmtB family transcription factor n=1 Tax=Salisediminibacterium halotolerans TaxID=517425 RepID=UPI000EAF1637|nr:metalloregulator ArsR/SmtB family transcription factor [Salisediminibacterium halotolerans]RLJ73272.1 cadmium-sensing regulator CadC [Actinophytocola xinjiangensis]RPE86694.1 cadmium-sensing regulator CadC [Salisediminibacterium halotolerans]TWG34069.1 cadmium-sensing regulator CadC [Salisediminibacterium halotolerans]GEL07584.1 transcriptional regulator [Salisediminibacterium halotolerans]